MPQRKSPAPEKTSYADSGGGMMMSPKQAWRTPPLMKATTSRSVVGQTFDDRTKEDLQYFEKISHIRGLKKSPWGISYLNDAEPIKELYRSLAFTTRKGHSNAVCKCRKHIDPDSLTTFLIGCSKCGKWFHAQCVGIAEVDLRTLRVFDCPQCAEKITNTIVLKKMKEAELARQCRKRKTELIKKLESEVEAYEGKNNLLRREIETLKELGRTLHNEISIYESIKEGASMEPPGFINCCHQPHESSILDPTPSTTPFLHEKQPPRRSMRRVYDSSLVKDGTVVVSSVDDPASTIMTPAATAATATASTMPTKRKGAHSSSSSSSSNRSSSSSSSSKSKTILRWLKQMFSRETQKSGEDLLVADDSHIDANRILISHHTLDGTFVYSSPASIHVLGYEVEEILNMNLFALIHPDDARLVSNWRMKNTQVKSNSIFTAKYRLRRKDMTFVQVESSFRPIFCEDFQGFHCISQLISRHPATP
jgi:PAS domain S-box-containing protein